jgi:hypothetical protein
MQDQVVVRCLSGERLSFYGRLVGRQELFNGFAKQYTGMTVIRGDDGVLAVHVDTRAQIENAILVDKIEDLAGFFGFCPLAISLYRSLGINVRAVA